MADQYTPPQPPQVRRQQISPMMLAAAQHGSGAQPGTQQAGGELVDQLGQKISELEKWTSDVNTLVSSLKPELKALLGPIAQVGKAFQKEVMEMKKRAGQSVPGQAPQAGAQQGQEQGDGAGGADVPNPAEGAAVNMAS